MQDPRDDVSSEHQVAEDMLDFLQEFFEGEYVPSNLFNLRPFWR